MLLRDPGIAVKIINRKNASHNQKKRTNRISHLMLYWIQYFFSSCYTGNRTSSAAAISETGLKRGGLGLLLMTKIAGFPARARGSVSIHGGYGRMQRRVFPGAEIRACNKAGHFRRSGSDGYTESESGKQDSVFDTI